VVLPEFWSQTRKTTRCLGVQGEATFSLRTLWLCYFNRAKAMTDNAKQAAYYFGCMGQPGHYMHMPNGSRARYDSIEGMPWNLRLWDGTLLHNGRIPDQETGKVYFTCGGITDNWFAFFWWDNSVDNRPGSNSGFYVSGFGQDEQQAAFDFACQQWPKVVKRQRHPLSLQPYLHKPPTEIQEKGNAR
jgi:hypothetical protein